jgi:hypothetical protein
VGEKGGSRGKEEVMTQALYAHRNKGNKIINCFPQVFVHEKSNIASTLGSFQYFRRKARFGI